MTMGFLLSVLRLLCHGHGLLSLMAWPSPRTSAAARSRSWSPGTGPRRASLAVAEARRRARPGPSGLCPIRGRRPPASPRARRRRLRGRSSWPARSACSRRAALRETKHAQPSRAEPSRRGRGSEPSPSRRPSIDSARGSCRRPRLASACPDRRRGRSRRAQPSSTRWRRASGTSVSTTIDSEVRDLGHRHTGAHDVPRLQRLGNDRPVDRRADRRVAKVHREGRATSASDGFTSASVACTLLVAAIPRAPGGRLPWPERWRCSPRDVSRARPAASPPASCARAARRACARPRRRSACALATWVRWSLASRTKRTWPRRDLAPLARRSS